MLPRAVAVVAAFAALAPPPSAAPDELAERCARVERELGPMLRRAGVPGLSIACASAEGPVWSHAAGVRDAATPEDGEPAAVDAETVFEAASLSKPVFAYVVLQLVDAGLLELDAPLVDYAPLADLAGDRRHEEITARMVLSHATGLPNWRPPGGRLELHSDPGERWTYSGEGFALLQRVVEALAAESLAQLAQRFVFEPLGMTRSSFVWREDLAPNVALPHDAQGRSQPMRQLAEGEAAFSLLTTASDYALFLAAILRGEGLAPETRELLATPQVDVDAGVTWGLGFGLEEHPDGLALWHWGHNDGYRAYMLAFPARDFAFVFFANGENGMLLLEHLVELVTGEDEHPALAHLGYASYTSAAAATELEWTPVESGSQASLRGLCAVSAEVAWASGERGTVLRTADGAEWTAAPVPGAEELDLRDVEAFDAERALVIGAGSPARVYRTEDGGASWTLAYENADERAFLDAMAFWDERRGLAFSDPIDGKLLVIATADGGASWKALPAAALPDSPEGEAGFAASGTCLALGGTANAWIGLGGAHAARVFATSDGGASWSAATTPLVSGASSTGIFSLAFFDGGRGVAVGGDHEAPDATAGNAAWTSDGGATWKLVEGEPPTGYRSCVVALPDTPGPTLVAVGPNGSDLSTDGGLTWRRFSDAGYHAVACAPDGTVWASGADGRLAKLGPRRDPGGR